MGLGRQTADDGQLVSTKIPLPIAGYLAPGPYAAERRRVQMPNSQYFNERYIVVKHFGETNGQRLVPNNHTAKISIILTIDIFLTIFLTDLHAKHFLIF